MHIDDTPHNSTACYDDAIDRLNQHTNCLYDACVALGNYRQEYAEYLAGERPTAPLADNWPLTCSPRVFYKGASDLVNSIECLIKEYAILFNTTSQRITYDMELYSVVIQARWALYEINEQLFGAYDELIAKADADGMFDKLVIRL